MINIGNHFSVHLTRRREKANKPIILASSWDDDSEDFDFIAYGENIEFCIKEKSKRILKNFSGFHPWILILVDFICRNISEDDFSKISERIVTLGKFDELLLLNYFGDKVLLHKTIVDNGVLYSTR